MKWESHFPFEQHGLVPVEHPFELPNRALLLLLLLEEGLLMPVVLLECVIARALRKGEPQVAGAFRRPHSSQVAHFLLSLRRLLLPCKFGWFWIGAQRSGRDRLALSGFFGGFWFGFLDEF